MEPVHLCISTRIDKLANLYNNDCSSHIKLNELPVYTFQPREASKKNVNCKIICIVLYIVEFHKCTFFRSSAFSVWITDMYIQQRFQDIGKISANCRIMVFLLTIGQKNARVKPLAILIVFGFIKEREKSETNRTKKFKPTKSNCQAYWQVSLVMYTVCLNFF